MCGKESQCNKPNLVPRVFSLFKVVDWRNSWTRLLKYSKNHGEFCHMTHDEGAFSEVVSSVGRPCLFSAIENHCSKETKRFHGVYMTNSHECLEPLWQPWPGVSPIRHFERGEDPGDEVVTKRSHDKHILSVPVHFVKSGFYCRWFLTATNMAFWFASKISTCL